MKKTLARIVIAVLVVVLLVSCKTTLAPETKSDSPPPAETETSAPAAETEKTDDGLAEYYTGNAEYEVVNAEGTKSLDDYYAQFDVECDMTIRSDGPDLHWNGGADVPLPAPNEKYTIGFSVYYTVDEVGAMYLEGMKDAAAEVGIELLINDADYDQNLQNQAIEQWILQGVDAVIMTACDFYGVKDALDSLEEAGIPVITLDAPPCAGSVDSVVMYDCVEQGREAGEALERHLLDNGIEMSGEIYYGTLPFVHPNAVTREYGFFEVFNKYDDIEVKALTGEGPEDHYKAFEGIMMSDADILGFWGLYSSATYGIMQAVEAGGYDYPITSIDNDRVILEGIYNGKVLGSDCYGAVEGSRLALAMTILKLNGENVPAIIYQGNTYVDKSNVEEAFEEYYNGKTLADYMAGKH